GKGRAPIVRWRLRRRGLVPGAQATLPRVLPRGRGAGRLRTMSQRARRLPGRARSQPARARVARGPVEALRERTLEGFTQLVERSPVLRGGRQRAVERARE